MTTTARQILIAARDLIAERARWCQAAPAADNRDQPVPILSASAVAFCAIGALFKVWYSMPKSRYNMPKSSTNRKSQHYNDAFGYLSRSMGGGIASFNNSHTHEEVIAAFNLAIVATPD